MLKVNCGILRYCDALGNHLAKQSFYFLPSTRKMPVIVSEGDIESIGTAVGMPPPLMVYVAGGAHLLANRASKPRSRLAEMKSQSHVRHHDSDVLLPDDTNTICRYSGEVGGEGIDEEGHE